MPAESLALAVTSGLGVGVIAGIISGVCYVLVHGIVGNRPRKSKAQWHCTVCGARFRSIEGVLETGRVVTCLKCRGKICRAKCSSRENVGWICKMCQQPDSWFKGILKNIRPNCTQGVLARTNMDPEAVDESEEDVEEVNKKQKEHVRDFIERLVEAMLGSNIDNASIARIYDDSNYLPVIGQSPCSAHASLKLLIQRIIQEALGLPPLKQAEERPGSPAAAVGDRTYEDLLATAILNKVIQNYQDELPASSANSISSKLSSSSLRNKRPLVGEEASDAKWKNGNGAAADVDTTSVSSLEEWVRSDSSIGSTKYVDHNLLSIQQRIEEASSSDDEVPSCRNHLAADGSEWQENWTFQKRKIGGTASPVPVPMLVPNPAVEAKVLIGDREAEDTTDLSDAGSDFGDVGSVQGIETILVESKSVIGGKNPLINLEEGTSTAVAEKGASEEETTESSDPLRETQTVVEDFRDYSLDSSAEASLPRDNEEASLISLESNTEQDTEYTEKYATLPRTIMKSPPPPTRNVQEISDSLAKNQHAEPAEEEPVNHQSNGYHEPDITDEELSEKFKGTYSEREKQKWNHAVEMKNNPYSAENLTRRLSTRSNADSNSSLFGRDYYVKEAAKSTGARKKQEEQEKEELDAITYKTVPAVVDNTPGHTDESTPTSPLRSVELSSDSDLSIERVYNLNSGQVYEKVGTKEVIAASRSPPGRRRNTFDFDENHNTNDKRKSFLRSLTNDESEPESFGTVSNSTPVEIIVTPEKSPFETVNGDVVQESAAKILDECQQESSTTEQLPPETVNRDVTRDSLENNLNDSLPPSEFSLEYSVASNEESTTAESLGADDPEISILKDKHLVKERLGLFSKSYPNLAAAPLRKSGVKNDALQQKSGFNRSTEELRQKFEFLEEEPKNKNSIKMQQVYSLTARTIPKEFRKELNLKDTSAHFHNSETPVAKYGAIIQEETRIFPTAKSRIQFFENLRR